MDKVLTNQRDSLVTVVNKMYVMGVCRDVFVSVTCKMLCQNYFKFFSLSEKKNVAVSPTVEAAT